MNLFRLFTPKPTLSEQETAHGLRMLTREGIVSMGFGGIAGGAFLAAFALALGANYLQIGILAAIPSLMQPLQIPIILLVERLKQRKLIAVSGWFLAQLLWFPMALIPFFIGTPSAGAISMLLGLMAVRSIFSAAVNCSWNSWVRDLVPQQILGRYYSRRLALGTVVAVVFGLAAAFFIDYWRGQVPSENVVFGYTYAILFGALFLGLASPVFMSRMPEPLMQTPLGPKPSLRETITAPLRNNNFRRMMMFLLFWGFASNLAVPFFAVYMLQRLGLPLLTVILLSVVSQLFNIMFLRVWGPLADRVGSKTVLSLSVSLYLLVILGWTFTTMPERYFLTIPLLVILHIFAGIAAAGVSLTVGTIGMKLSPQGQATSFLAGSSLAISLGAGIGPLVGGVLADFFNARNLALDFTWAAPTRTIELGVINLTSFDFLFIIAFIVGLVTLSVLASVREEGEVTREVALGELASQTRTFSQAVSSVPGLGFVTMFPFTYLRHIPGVDVATGVTAYELANIAKTATVTAVRGHRLTKKLAKTLESRLKGIWKTREVAKEHGIEITRQVARGAMHVVKEKPLAVEELVSPVISSVVKVSSRAGVNPLDAILGASQGIIQGAAETGIDLGEATLQTILVAREVAAQIGLSEDVAVAKAAEGALQAAEAIGPEAVAEVAESLPDEILALGDKGDKQ